MSGDELICYCLAILTLPICAVFLCVGVRIIWLSRKEKKEAERKLRAIRMQCLYIEKP
jgi:hypothetical protein